MKQLLRVIMSLLLLMYCAGVMAQTADVSGKVIDEQGEPVIGASVVQKGTSNGTVTDIDGNFTFKAPQNATLVVSYVGYKSVEVKAGVGIKVQLQTNASELNEVVVTGYTTPTQSRFLQELFSVVSVDELAKQNENNPMKALQGRVPGMNISADGSPSGSATVRIRGIGTLNNNDPLYIIDGVPTKAGMHELNGSDIESIQVLKDASSASIYGSRAANGVIIITTKKGKEGRVNVDIDASIAASMYAHKMKVLCEQYGQVMWQAYVNDGMDPNTNGLGYRYDWGVQRTG